MVMSAKIAEIRKGDVFSFRGKKILLCLSNDPDGLECFIVCREVSLEQGSDYSVIDSLEYKLIVKNDEKVELLGEVNIDEEIEKWRLALIAFTEAAKLAAVTNKRVAENSHLFGDPNKFCIVFGDIEEQILPCFTAADAVSEKVGEMRISENRQLLGILSRIPKVSEKSIK